MGHHQMVVPCIIKTYSIGEFIALWGNPSVMSQLLHCDSYVVVNNLWLALQWYTHELWLIV